jgi:hypothetical protein
VPVRFQSKGNCFAQIAAKTKFHVCSTLVDVQHSSHPSLHHLHHTGAHSSCSRTDVHQSSLSGVEEQSSSPLARVSLISSHFAGSIAMSADWIDVVAADSTTPVAMESEGTVRPLVADSMGASEAKSAALALPASAVSDFESEAKSDQPPGLPLSAAAQVTSAEAIEVDFMDVAESAQIDLPMSASTSASARSSSRQRRAPDFGPMLSETGAKPNANTTAGAVAPAVASASTASVASPPLVPVADELIPTSSRSPASAPYSPTLKRVLHLNSPRKKGEKQLLPTKKDRLPIPPEEAKSDAALLVGSLPVDSLAPAEESVGAPTVSLSAAAAAAAMTALHSKPKKKESKPRKERSLMTLTSAPQAASTPALSSAVAVSLFHSAASAMEIDGAAAAASTELSSSINAVNRSQIDCTNPDLAAAAAAPTLSTSLNVSTVVRSQPSSPTRKTHRRSSSLPDEALYSPAPAAQSLPTDMWPHVSFIPIGKRHPPGAAEAVLRFCNAQQCLSESVCVSYAGQTSEPVLGRMQPFQCKLWPATDVSPYSRYDLYRRSNFISVPKMSEDLASKCQQLWTQLHSVDSPVAQQMQWFRNFKPKTAARLTLMGNSSPLHPYCSLETIEVRSTDETR